MVEVYLDNLISSSLVICLNEIGDEPIVQLHDLVDEFCLIKSRKEKLFDFISSSAPSSSSDLMPRQMTIEYDMDHFGSNNLVLLDSKKKRHSGKHLYSLLIVGDKLDGRLSDICHLRHLRLLRVLNLDPRFIRVKDSLLNEICMLNHLRCLCIGTEVTALPSSFSNLLNLEIMYVANEGPPLVLLPIIWNLVKLQLLSVLPSLFDLDTYEPIRIAEDSKLENLRFLADLTLSYSKDTEDIFKRFPNLQDLSFDLKESWDFSTERYWFPKLDFLNELESLWVNFIGSNSNDNEPSVGTNRLWDFHLPSSLKKLSLWQFPLTFDALSTIARLPKLEELSLLYPMIQEEEWNMGEEDTFENLKCLKLYEVTLAKWEVGEESFPVLEKLELLECCKLVEIPPSFGDIGSLKIIRLIDSPQLEDSANNIKQYAEDMRGGDELQVQLE
ncbi:hypothetical protein HAX54_034402 [Datura stramonium]|uniref:Uncharacterized protein n=1 Tax=Datura stramonium TaxID=4076 RepID=A0ABS8VFC9_DATST|nr:hypothetical protein [Datura stramonium]